MFLVFCCSLIISGPRRSSIEAPSSPAQAHTLPPIPIPIPYPYPHFRQRIHSILTLFITYLFLEGNSYFQTKEQRLAVHPALKMRPNTAKPIVNIVTNKMRSSKDLLPPLFARSSIFPSAAGAPFKMSPVQNLSLRASPFRPSALNFGDIGGLKTAKKVGLFAVCKRVVR